LIFNNCRVVELLRIYRVDLKKQDVRARFEEVRSRNEPASFEEVKESLKLISKSRVSIF
jgi:hypothetical protein